MGLCSPVRFDLALDPAFEPTGRAWREVIRGAEKPWAPTAPPLSGQAQTRHA